MKNLILLLIILISLVSCNDFLEPLPKGEIVAKTTGDFRKILDNAHSRYSYSFAQTSLYVDVVSDNVQIDSLIWNSWDEQRLHVRNLYSFEEEVWSRQGATEDVTWKNAYYISSLVSNILDQIHIADDNKSLQQQLIAEAKVHRAYAYLTLVNIYAKHYNEQTASNDLGVPIITNPVELPSLKRASVQEVYDFILSDLNDAIEGLPDDVQGQYIHRPSKASAYAILARTYLYMGNYEQALEYADKSLAIEDFLYDYNTIYTGDAFAENVNGISRTTDKEMLLYKTTNKGAHLSSYMILDKETFNNVYSGYDEISSSEVNNYDLRRTLWFEGINSNGTIRRDSVVYTFSDASTRYSLDNDGQIDYIPIATPEMYLTRAECNARLGNLQAAIDDINTIRNHRYKTGTYTDITLADFGDNQENVVAEVLLERRRELYGKELRLFDVKRLGLPVTHTLGTRELSVPSNDSKLVWPIFYGNLEDSNMEQNPR